MNVEKDVLKSNAIFFIGSFLYLFIGMGFIQYFGKEELHLLINRNNFAFLDFFFKYITNLGNITLVLLVLFILFKYNWKTLFTLSFAYALGSILGAIVKRNFFKHVHRPTYYFEQKGIPLHEIEGVSSQIPYTFPSGHTMAAFCVFLFISMQTNNKWFQLSCIVSAILVGLSRVYLSKHFMIDTLGGAVLGLFAMCISYYIFAPIQHPFLNKKILKK